MSPGQAARRPPIDEDPWAIPLRDYDPGRRVLFQHDAIWPYFARLRREAPVHYCHTGEFGPYWSITRCRVIAGV